MLARLNPGVDPAEIKNLQTHQASLEEALTETRYRLDSLHLVVVESWVFYTTSSSTWFYQCSFS